LFPLNYSLVCDSIPLLPYKYHHHPHPAPVGLSPGHQRAIYERLEKTFRLPASHLSALYGAAAAAAHQTNFPAAPGHAHPAAGGHSAFPGSGGGGGGGGIGGGQPSREMPVVQKSLKAMLGGGGSVSKPNKERYG
jgi:hypothetical protein